MAFGLREVRNKLAKAEAAAIAKLTGKRKLRVHVVGDCASNETAAIVGRSMVLYERKRGKVAWTYTHAWREILRAAWQGARVLASCEKPSEVREAWARGYAAALVVPPHPTNKVYEYHGLKIVPCPAQFRYNAEGKLVTNWRDGDRRVTCEHCTLCQRPDELLARGLTIGFQPDGNTTAKILPMLEVTDAR